jgi:hypothetical protein
MDLDLIFQAIDAAGATVLFGIAVMTSFALIILMALFFLLVIRGLFYSLGHWLARHTVNDVVVSVQRRAFRQR